MKKIKNLIYLFRRAWNISKIYFLVTAVKSIFTALISLANIVGLGFIIDALVSGQSKGNILKLIIIYLSINLGISLANQALQLWQNNVMRKESNVLQYQYMQDCLDIDYHYIQDGKILNLKQKSMTSQPAFFLDLWGQCFKNIIQFIGVISIVSALSPLFIIIIILLSAMLITITAYTKKCDYNFQHEKIDDERKLDYLYDIMTEYKYAKEIRINNASEYIKQKYHFVFEIQIQKLRQLLHKKLGVNLLAVFLSIVQTAAMYLYFTYQVFNSQINISEYTVLLASTTLFTSTLLSAFENFISVNNNIKAIEFHKQYEEIIKFNCITSDSNHINDVKLDFSSATIQFENVSFIYPNAKEYVLKNVNIEIAANKKLGIVGLNGSGKTTLIKLLLRLYHPTQGKIMLNGVDIANIPYKQYISHIGVVLQDFALFAYSLKENIIFNGSFDSERLLEVIDKSDLTSKVEQLSNGVDTSIYRELDDNGIEFSGGEGQKLALARALYKNADILILDEPTSALDPIAEYELFSRFHDISDNRTTIFISHRLSSTHFCDSIVVLQNGSVIEQGTHTELMSRNGFYADLFNRQARYYSGERVAGL